MRRGHLFIIIVVAALVMSYSGSGTVMALNNCAAAGPFLGGCAFPFVDGGTNDVLVRTIQNLLNYHGADPQLVVDGTWGSATASAVKAFQSANGLSVDGEVGHDTWMALIVLCSEGDAGDQVRAVQDQLVTLFNYTLTVDGSFGSATSEAVESFQNLTCISVDGVVGDDTWMNLLSGCNSSYANIYGLDQSHYQGDVTLSDYQCLFSQSFRFGIFLAQESNRAISPYILGDLANAQAAGFKSTDVYAFLDFNSNDEACSQINNTLSYLVSNKASFGRIWFDIEGTKDTSISFNQDFVQNCERIASETYGVPVGIYCSKNSWNAIFGSGFAPSSINRHPLWFAHYDNIPSFVDWTIAGAYGGWTAPTIKQFLGTTDLCNTQLDYNWSPQYPTSAP